jgi:hypothetical protein
MIKQPIKPLPSVEYLRECFMYDKKTGELRWRVRPLKHFATGQSWRRCNTLFGGKTAGMKDKRKGHWIVSIDGRDYKAHRVIWKLITGNEPCAEIDHMDGDGANNSWLNLRAATDGEQRWNSAFLSTNTSGRRGVIWNKRLGKWQAAICVRGFRRHLGMFCSLDDASETYEAVAREAHGKFYRQPAQSRSV